jgi:hypothetical protein
MGLSAGVLPRSFVLLVALMGCRQEPAAARVERTPSVERTNLAAPVPPPPSPEAKRWTWKTTNGAAEISQTFVATNKCRVEGRGPGGEWHVDDCLGTSGELWFAAPSGDRLIKLDPLPLGVDDWELAPVVTLFDRGKQVGGTNAAALMGDDQSLHRFSRRFAWLKGTSDIPGQAPSLGDDGVVVSGEAADGKKFRFAFANWSGVPPPGTRGARPLLPASGGSPSTAVGSDPSQPGPKLTRFFCSWTGEVVGGQRWHGCYSNFSAESWTIEKQCRESARSDPQRGLEGVEADIRCVCSTNPQSVEVACRPQTEGR